MNNVTTNSYENVVLQAGNLQAKLQETNNATTISYENVVLQTGNHRPSCKKHTMQPPIPTGMLFCKQATVHAKLQ